MPGYHIGTLDEASKRSLNEGEAQGVASDPNVSRPTFLESRAWNKAVLHARKILSWDSRLFTYKLDHEGQLLGLPIGQHLMIRLRDPVTRDAIIRSYTPISETSKKGYVDVLIKVYFDHGEVKGGKMTKAMEALPIGHGVDFKGPIGKFEYCGKGACLVNGNRRLVKKFAMICGGSGITPIFQVFRAIMNDPDDVTRCTVLDGNRLVEDILCKQEMDALCQGKTDKGMVIHTLTKAPKEWNGLRGRIDGNLVREHCHRDDDTMVLICGPEALEKSVHMALKEQGWRDEQLLFF